MSIFINFDSMIFFEFPISYFVKLFDILFGHFSIFDILFPIFY